MSIIKQAESIVEFRKKINDLKSSNFPVWEMERITDFVNFAVEKLSPLQFGDVAELIKTPEISTDSWWYCHRHTLVSGRKGIIREVNWNNKFLYLWEPENQTWISSTDGIERPVDRPSLYTFSEEFLKKHVGI